jgi:FkbM family methyltransferase
MPVISYAQNFEDVMLYRALKHVETGFFVDLGAYHPEHDSVSMLFSKIGWTGVHVEPQRRFADALRAARPQDKVLELAVGTGTEPMILHEIVGGEGITTGDRALAERHAAAGFTVRETRVEVRTLAGILDKDAPEDIHWLKIDVEGMEGDVIRSWEGSAKRPWIVLVESTEPLLPTPNYQS